MLFDFKLRPVNAIEPWTSESGRHLSWFGFTDGYYRLNVGNDSLFAYSISATERLRAKHPDFVGEYADYQVVRLWEDVLDMLPDVLSPIPPRLADLLSGPEPRVADWLRAADEWWRNLPDDAPKEEEDRFDGAVTWLGRRHLDSLYLIAGPRIWLWSTPETVTITWDNRGLVIEDTVAWAAQCGTFSLPRATFLCELQTFHDSLITQMAQRVNEVCANWTRPDVQIDFEQLRREQAERALAHEAALQRAPEPESWPAVLEAVDYLGSKTKT